MKKLFVALAALAPLAACGEAPEPLPAADPAQIERLASLTPDAAEAPEEALEEKLAEADRLAGTIEKIQPEKIDPNVVVRVLAR